MNVATGDNRASLTALALGPQTAAPPVAVGRGGAGSDLATARRTAQQFIGETFYGLMLKELRKTTSQEHLLFGGRGEETMQPLLDQYVGQKLAASTQFELSNVMVERIYRHASGGKEQQA